MNSKRPDFEELSGYCVFDHDFIDMSHVSLTYAVESSSHEGWLRAEAQWQ